jgi:hypothetical protein
MDKAETTYFSGWTKESLRAWLEERQHEKRFYDWHGDAAYTLTFSGGDVYEWTAIYKDGGRSCSEDHSTIRINGVLVMWAQSPGGQPAPVETPAA